MSDGLEGEPIIGTAPTSDRPLSEAEQVELGQLLILVGNARLARPEMADTFLVLVRKPLQRGLAFDQMSARQAPSHRPT